MSNSRLRSFTAAIASVERGDIASELDENMSEIIRVLQERGKGKASLTLTVNFDADGERIDLDCDVKTRLPKKQRRKTPFWIADGALSTEHPRQTDMFPVAVPAPARA